MIFEIPQYALRAYALFFARFGYKEQFQQSVLEWSLSESMRKKVFFVLLRSGWIRKKSRNTYVCVSPDKIMKGLIEFRVPEIIKRSSRDYAFTGLSAVEIWSDYAYVQRSIDKSPYFIKILKKDLGYWKVFFNTYQIPNYVGKGTSVGEYVILIPVKRIASVRRDGLFVESLQQTKAIAKGNDLFSYAYEHMREKNESSAA